MTDSSDDLVALDDLRAALSAEALRWKNKPCGRLPTKRAQDFYDGFGLSHEPSLERHRRPGRLGLPGKPSRRLLGRYIAGQRGVTGDLSPNETVLDSATSQPASLSVVVAPPTILLTPVATTKEARATVAQALACVDRDPSSLTAPLLPLVAEDGIESSIDRALEEAPAWISSALAERGVDKGSISRDPDIITLVFAVEGAQLVYVVQVRCEISPVSLYELIDNLARKMVHIGEQEIEIECDPPTCHQIGEPMDKLLEQNSP